MKATVDDLKNKLGGFEKENDDLNNNLDHLQAVNEQLKSENEQLKKGRISTVNTTPFGLDDPINIEQEAALVEADVITEGEANLEEEKYNQQKRINEKYEKYRQAANQELDRGRALKKARTSTGGSSEHSESSFVRH